MNKFDIAIMNPPYDGSLHLKILEKVIPIADEVVNISPIRWLQDPLAKYKKNSDFNKRQDSIIKYIKDLKYIDAKEAQRLFSGTVMGMDFGVYKLDNNGGWKNPFIPSFIERIAKYQIEHPAPFETLKKDGYRVRISMISGGKSGGSGIRKKVNFEDYKHLGNHFVFKDGILDGKKWYEFYGKNQHSKTTDEITNSIHFDSKEEADNFLYSYDTIFAKIIWKFIVTDVHISNTSILWMGNAKNPRTGKIGYKSDWTNEDFCKYFNITGYISDSEAEPGSEWEEILNTMAKYK